MDEMDRKDRQPEEDRVGRASSSVPRRAPQRTPSIKYIAEHANKTVIGDDPNLIKPGQVLKIPEKP